MQETARRLFDDLGKSRQWLNEPGLDYFLRLTQMARRAGVTLDKQAIHMRLNPRWKNALALRLVEPNLSPGTLLDYLRDGSHTIDDPDHTRVNMAGPSGRPYSAPSRKCQNCSSSPRCVCAFEPSPSVAAIGNSPIDWTTYPLCPAPADRRVIPDEFLGDFRENVGLRERVKKAGRCEKCRGLGAPHKWGQRADRDGWYYDAKGNGHEMGMAMDHAHRLPENPPPAEAGFRRRGRGNWRGRGRGQPRDVEQ
jgi:hypothetical protein